MDAAFTTIRYFGVERRMLNGAAGSCQWGKEFPLAGFDGVKTIRPLGLVVGCTNGEPLVVAIELYWQFHTHTQKKILTSLLNM